MIAGLAQLPDHDAAQTGIVLHDQNRLGAAPRRWLGGSINLQRRALFEARQVQTERRAFTDLAIGTDMSAGLLHEAEHHGQTEAGSLAQFLRREERFEY